MHLLLSYNMIWNYKLGPDISLVIMYLASRSPAFCRLPVVALVLLRQVLGCLVWQRWHYWQCLAVLGVLRQRLMFPHPFFFAKHLSQASTETEHANTLLFGWAFSSQSRTAVLIPNIMVFCKWMLLEPLQTFTQMRFVCLFLLFL